MAHFHAPTPHGHAHSHPHSHVDAADYGRAFAIGVALNLSFVVVEAVAGLAAGSVALLADAGHNLSDVLGLLVAWGGARLARRRPSPRFTYGWRRTTILAALANGLFLLVATGAIALEAVQRLLAPQPVAGQMVMAVAAIGIVINALTAWLFAAGRGADLNVRAAYLHMLGDAGVSAGVVVAGGLVWLTGASWIDPVTSLVVVALILWGTWGLLREAVVLAMDAVPSGIDAAAVAATLRALPGVERLHDLHIWAMSTTEVALTARLVIPGGHPGDSFLRRAADLLHDRHGIEHSTLQIEIERGDPCRLHGMG
ncbi:cation diffusion facilitator family transporter [Sphingomonas sp.]|uniref:cation diffusion facilitator family transporter n=1 Tax=Sphingomonas sp. TaxID=28214 RepID=UPI001DCC95B3|nr:cation diffusion facilitator family transporter [Sphingomonas sp.]MBX9795448.1 cation diffusion facilitator family transporter [Sphingomonas sp.]